MNSIALAIDMGGSKYMVGLVDRQGHILAKRREVWTNLTADGVAEDVVKAAHSLLNAHPDISPQVIGATIPGLADPWKGLWMEASFSGIRNLPIAKNLETAFGLPAYVDNDGQACALAEKMFGACQNTTDFLYLTVSNGIGGSIWVHDRLVYGGDFTAGEFGHCTVVEDGRPCKCGKKGCLEMYAAGPGLSQTYAELGGAPLPDGRPADGVEIARRAREGEQIALHVFELEGTYLGRIIAMSCNLLNPRKVILGGGLSLAFSLYETSLKDTLKKHMYLAANPSLVVQPTTLGYDGGLLGAAAVSFSRLEHLYEG